MKPWMRFSTFLSLSVIAITLGACGNPTVRVTELDGKWGNNTVTEIQIDPRAPCPRATFAQELWEARYKRSPSGLAQLVDSSVQREMEIMGHEVESVAAAEYCGLNTDDYRKQEAQTIHRGYDGLFSGTPPEVIEARMKERTADARRWLKSHRSVIEAVRIE